MKRSWITQRLANALPPWSDARTRSFSNFQQMLNPTAQGIETTYKLLFDIKDNYYLGTANLDELANLRVVYLPNDFVFGTYVNEINNEVYIPPTITGTINGSPNLEVDVAVCASMREMWYETLPSRVVYSGYIKDYSLLLPNTRISELDDRTSFDTILHPNHLTLRIMNGSDFVDYSRATMISTLIIRGFTAGGLEDSEVILVTHNGYYTTTKVWKQITAIEQYGFIHSDLGPVVKISCMSFIRDYFPDQYQILVSDQTEKVLYYQLDERVIGSSSGSVLCLLATTGNEMSDLYQGNETFESIYELELLDNNLALHLNALAVQPFTGNIFAIDNEYLYLFDSNLDIPDYRGYSDVSAGATVAIDASAQSALRGDTITFKPMNRVTGRPIVRTRWSVKRPDSSVIYLGADGYSTSKDANLWFYNAGLDTYEFGPWSHLYSGGVQVKSTQEISFTFTERGTYFVQLETIFADKSRQVDLMPIHVYSKQAAKSFALPATLQNATNLGFDSDQRLWILKDNHMYELVLATDTAIVDFTNKVVYLHEDYDSIEITESEDQEALL